MTPTSPNTAFEFGSKGTQNPVELYLEDLFTISSNLAGIASNIYPAWTSKFLASRASIDWKFS